jgi:hypothetical protein
MTHWPPTDKWLDSARLSKWPQRLDAAERPYGNAELAARKAVVKFMLEFNKGLHILTHRDIDEVLVAYKALALVNEYYSRTRLPLLSSSYLDVHEWSQVFYNIASALHGTPARLTDMYTVHKHLLGYGDETYYRAIIESGLMHYVNKTMEVGVDDIGVAFCMEYTHHIVLQTPFYRDVDKDVLSTTGTLVLKAATDSGAVFDFTPRVCGIAIARCMGTYFQPTGLEEPDSVASTLTVDDLAAIHAACGRIAGCTVAHPLPATLLSATETTRGGQTRKAAVLATTKGLGEAIFQTAAMLHPRPLAIQLLRQTTPTGQPSDYDIVAKVDWDEACAIHAAQEPTYYVSVTMKMHADRNISTTATLLRTKF